VTSHLLFLAQRRENLFDLIVEWEASGVCLGENHGAVDDHVELAGFPCFDPGVFAETGLE